MIPETERLHREQFLEKPLPSSADSERAILGGVQLDQNLILSVISSLKPTDFYSPLHRTVATAMYALAERQETIDAITVGEEIKKSGSLDSIGGMATIANLTYGLPHFSDLIGYINIVKDKSLLRQLIKLFSQMIEMSLSEEYTAQEVLDYSEQQIFTLRDSIEVVKSDYSLAIVAASAHHKKILENYKTKKPTGLQTGLVRCDEMTSGKKKGELTITGARPSMGKAQPLDARIPTPNGWQTMGNLKVGSVIFAGNGQATVVSAVFPQGQQHIYRVRFSDETSTECVLEHLWLVQSRKDRKHGKEGQILTTKEIIEQGLICENDNRLNFSVPYAKPVTYPAQKNLLIHPYLLGALIGNGYLTNKKVEFTSSDADTIAKVSSLLGLQKLVPQSANKPNCISYRINQGRSSILHTRLGIYGLMNKLSYDKFIPEAYLLGSIEQRLELLRGLLDTDGHIQKTGYIEYSTASHRLSEQVRELVLSLGGRCAIQTRMGKYKKRGDSKYITTRINYRLRIKFQNKDFNPFYCQRKAERFDAIPVKNLPKFIKSIEFVDIKEAQCIMVTSPTHLYLTDDFIVTHNSSLMIDDIIGIHRLQPEAVSVCFTAEMSEELCVARTVCQMAKVSLTGYLKSRLTHEEWKRVGEALKELQEFKIIYIHETGITPLRMKYHLRRIADKYGRLDDVSADYAEILDDDKEHESERHRVGAIALGCKRIATEFKVPFDLLSQLSRKPEMRNPPRPILSDLAESGKLEAHADVVRLIYRAEYYKKTTENEGIAEIIYAKNRNGATGTVKLAWQGFSTHFDNLAI